MSKLIDLLLKIIEWLWKKIIGSNLALGWLLSEEEKDILKGTTGNICKLSTDQTGVFVRAGKSDFYFESNMEKTAKYNEGLDSLIEKGLVVHESSKLFKLTSKGYQVSKKLK